MEPGTEAKNLGSCDRPVTHLGLLAEHTPDLGPPASGSCQALFIEHQLSPGASNSSKDRGTRENAGSSAPTPHPSSVACHNCLRACGFEHGIRTREAAAQALGKLTPWLQRSKPRRKRPLLLPEARLAECSEGARARGWEKREVILNKHLQDSPGAPPFYREEQGSWRPNECSPLLPRHPMERLSADLLLPATTLQLSKHQPPEFLEQPKKPGPWGAFPPLPTTARSIPLLSSPSA